MVRVVLPKCISCGTNDHVVVCKMCGEFTCYECMHITQEDECEHYQPDEAESSDWHGYKKEDYN